MDVFNQLEDFLLNRISLSSKSKHPIYIFPTMNGFKVLTLNFLLLIIGLIYANNYVLLFNFLLFCLVLSSMFYTHHNLKNIWIKSFAPISGHNKELAYLNVVLSSDNIQNNFELKTRLPKSFYFDAHTILIELITFEKAFNLKIPLSVKRRGKTHISGFFLETDFPFGFFKCFTFYPLDIDLVLYPARIAHHNRQATSFELNVLDGKNEDDHLSYRSYQVGDSFNRLNWKRYAKDRQMNVVVHSQTEHLVDFINIKTKSIIDNHVIETILEQAAYDLNSSYQHEKKFCLLVNDSLVIESGSGKEHLERCLKFVGLYEH